MIRLLALWLALFPGRAVAVQATHQGQTGADTTFLEIGVLDGDRNYIFGQIEDVDVDSDGNIVVLDRRSYTVSWFASDGRFLGVVGREGDGPAEFRGPEGMAVGPNNHIYVLDAPNRRVLVFVLSDDGPVAARALSVVPVFASDICIRGRGSDVQTDAPSAVRRLLGAGYPSLIAGLSGAEAATPLAPGSSSRSCSSSSTSGDGGQ